MTAISQTAAHQGRWGWHPCNKEEFLKLKEAHKAVLQARKQTKRYLAWNAKMPHNRQGRPKPFEPAILISKNYYHCVLVAYRAARTPQPSPEIVKPIRLPWTFWADIESLSKTSVSV